VACSYFSDTVCKLCTHCSPRSAQDGGSGKDAKTDFQNEGYTHTKCQLDAVDSFDALGDRSFTFPESVYTVAADTICVPCYDPHNNGFEDTAYAVRGGEMDGFKVLTTPAGPEWQYDQKDERVTGVCTEWEDTKYVECTMCPCANRPTCEYMTTYCTEGDHLMGPAGDLVKCADCTKIRGGQMLKADGLTESKPF